MNLRIVVIVLLLLPLLAHAEGVAKLVGYLSPVDRSEQVYGVYLPDAPRPAGGYPVALHAHGYGWSVHSGFSQWQKDWADAHAWILVQLNARGPNFYWGIGDVATKEVIDDLYERFGIDRTRVYITGGSMGGTGAYHQGVAHPDYIAVAAGVDGWTDFHEWHWHWYARKDQRDDIEEFRRPLLEAASPVFSAERALWGDVHAIADGRDNVVLPWQEIEFANRLRELGLDQEGTYTSGLTINYDKGHGGGYNLSWIYNYFLGRATTEERGRLRLATTVLEHGQLYWARMDALHHQGEKATLDCSTSLVDARELQSALGDVLLLDAFTDWRAVGPTPQDEAGDVWSNLPSDSAGVVNVITGNLDGVTLELAASPVADQERIAVFADGMPCYAGPPAILRLEALRDEMDAVCGWLAYPQDEKRAAISTWGFEKSPSICGPLGHAFVTPFVVCYGNTGSEQLQKQHREEAEAFCRGWNNFMVHGTGLEAVSEDAISPADIETRNLILYGTLETSRLLSRAQGVCAMPVEVHEDRVIVRDPITGDREYRGAKFGAFTVYPNPLTEGRTYLAVCKGRFATQPPNSSPHGLEFDLEKLSWGYSDYVIFNTNTAELPHVKNVNNKPPVTAYEAAYFVEAGYFDRYWQPDRFATIDRVRRYNPDKVRIIHVSEVRAEESKRSLPVWRNVDGEPSDPPRKDLPAPVSCVRVRVIDSSGKPVRQARVTGLWRNTEEEAVSTLTLSDGNAYFARPDAIPGHPEPLLQVLNVMATGAAYDFAADCLEAGPWISDDGALAARPNPVKFRADRAVASTPGVDLLNCGTQDLRVDVRFVSSAGKVLSGTGEIALAPGERTTARVRWMPHEDAREGTRDGYFELNAGGRTLVCPVLINFPALPDAQVRVTTLEGKDIVCGEPYEVKATLQNLNPSRAARLQMSCNLVSGLRRLGVREVILPPGGSGEVVWKPQSEVEPLPRGEHEARVSALGAGGVSGTCVFAVR